MAKASPLVREQKSSRGMYSSVDTRVLHFGLGNRGCDYPAVVRWPDGTSAELEPQGVTATGAPRAGAASWRHVAISSAVSAC